MLLICSGYINIFNQGNYIIIRQRIFPCINQLWKEYYEAMLSLFVNVNTKSLLPQNNDDDTTWVGQIVLQENIIWSPGEATL